MNMTHSKVPFLPLGSSVIPPRNSSVLIHSHKVAKICLFLVVAVCFVVYIIGTTTDSVEPGECFRFLLSLFGWDQNLCKVGFLPILQNQIFGEDAQRYAAECIFLLSHSHYLFFGFGSRVSTCSSKISNETRCEALRIRLSNQKTCVVFVVFDSMKL